ncbi:uncharacterized protein LOC132615566 [Lycium barbarum]|uniref:uncharacterized protein LOC132615566 n=1 Tax=Lycium barbarum TaxID=112863 RepID=UPI00293F079F|nr:uncharacterized protein LOC132615566 [Lycium barbarum]
MAMGPERSKPLHNFTLPCGLKWGNQKYLRCVKVDTDVGEMSSVHRRSELIQRRRQPEQKFRSINGEGIEAVREKLMFDLQTETDKMKNTILKEGLEYPAPENATEKAWNLRTRRAACNEPNGSKIDVNRSNGLVPIRMENNNNKSSRFRSDFAGGASCSGDKRERVKYSVPLLRREIEEDFMAMVGHRPPRRPKKRAKLVQKNLDTLFPGLWLTEITADLYKVPDDQ